MTVALFSASAFFLTVQPAAAQVEFAAGYQFFRFLEDDAVNVPAGWGASVAAPTKNTMLKIVGDVAGNYKDGGKLHTFQGGVELGGGSNPKTIPFVRLLAGLAVNSGEGDSDSAFAFTPEAGVKVMGAGRIGARFAVGFPIFRDSGETIKGFRLFAGIVCQ
jgi:hypothetical protein